MYPIDLYNKVASLSDIESLLSDTDDGESHHVEFKQVRLDPGVVNKADAGDFKLDIAKEMSAFANTDSGVIVLGYDGKENQIINNATNLQDWVDKNIADMLEPRLSGVMTKTLGDEEKIVVIYVPKGMAMPYRVGSAGSYSKKKSCVREYYQRVGTNSLPIPEPIVRTMYRTNNRVIDIEVSPKLIEKKEHLHESDSGRGVISLSLIVKPDSTRLIEKYYLTSEAYLLDSDFRIINDEPLVISENTLKDNVIPPTTELFELNRFNIRSRVNPNRASSLLPTIETENMDFHSTETVDLATFQNIFAIHVQTKYACDGMPMKVDNRIILTGDRKNIDSKVKPEESYWIDERCRVVRYISFGPGNNLQPMYAMEAYIRKYINHD